MSVTPWTIPDYDDVPEEMRGKRILLITPEELERMLDGTELYTVMGRRAVKGVDPIDDDTRAGYLAYGVVSA